MKTSDAVLLLLSDTQAVIQEAEDHAARALSLISHTPTEQRPFLPVHRLHQALQALCSAKTMWARVYEDAQKEKI